MFTIFSMITGVELHKLVSNTYMRLLYFKKTNNILKERNLNCIIQGTNKTIKQWVTNMTCFTFYIDINTSFTVPGMTILKQVAVWLLVAAHNPLEPLTDEVLPAHHGTH